MKTSMTRSRYVIWLNQPELDRARSAADKSGLRLSSFFRFAVIKFLDSQEVGNVSR